MKIAVLIRNVGFCMALCICAAGIVFISDGNSGNAAFKGFAGRFAAAELFGRSHTYKPASQAWTDIMLPALSKMSREEQTLVLEAFASSESILLMKTLQRGETGQQVLDAMQMVQKSDRSTGVWSVLHKTGMGVLSPSPDTNGVSTEPADKRMHLDTGESQYPVLAPARRKKT